MRKLVSHRFLAGLALLLLLLNAALPVAGSARAVQLDGRLLQELAAAPNGRDSFLVLLRDQADLSAADAIPNRTARITYVYQSLQNLASRSQASLRADLGAWGVPYHPFFIVNAIQVTGDEKLARRLAERPDVARIVADPTFNGLDDPPGSPPAPPAVDGVEWNVARLHAPDVWALGYTGQGIVVGSADTGVDYTHPALVNQYRGNLGGGNFDHNYNWHDTFSEYNVPTDPNGHGTHTTGTMVGSDDPAHPISATNAIGLAPGAQWIACKADSTSGTWRASKYIECWEWFLAPTGLNGQNPRPDLAPQVINNSWSCPGSEGCDLDTLLPAAEALYAAGIAIAKSGGNAGPNCGTTTNPGQYKEILATAAFAQGDAIAAFSSRGPMTYQGETRTKPDIAAPGVAIRSSVPGGGYGSNQGTSMASPHTAGLLALLWSAQPALIGDLDTTYQIVKGTAEPKVDLQCPPNGPGGHPNNVWGWGIEDALAAVQAATDTGLGTLRGIVYDNAFTPVPAAKVQVVPANYGPSRQVVADASAAYSLTLPAATYNITATHYGYLPGTATGVAVVSGTTTVYDLVMDRAAQWTLSGTVSDVSTGAPLRATLTLLDTPVSVLSDPASGFYTTTVAQGSYTLRASSPGYTPQERAITATGNLVEDFSLQPEHSYSLRDSTLPCGPIFNWIDITATGQPHNLSDDASEYVSLAGRQFSFYGTDYSALYIGSNGYVTFGVGSNWPGGNTIPSTFQPNNAIYAFWDDLNPANGSQGVIYTQLVDNHLFVIEFYQVQHWPNGNPETFETILDLDSGAVTLQYLTVQDTHWTSVGLENSDGTAGLAYSFHDPAYPTTTQALLLTPIEGTYPAEQGYGILSGAVVVSGSGAPIAGATVSALAFADGQVYSTTSAVDGAYSLTLCADLYTATASASGYYPSTPQVVAIYSGTGTLQDLALEPIPSCDPVHQADFSWQPLTPAAGQVVTLTGWASGTLPITYTWDFGDSSLVVGPPSVVTHTYAAPGTYTVLMTATNCQTATATAAHTITVQCQPARDADFSWQPLTPTAGQVVTFTGWASGTLPITYTWDFGDSSLVVGPSSVVTHTYAAAGDYTAVMTATNCGGQYMTTTSHVVTVVAACEPVHGLDFDWTPPTPTAGAAITFTATAAGTPPITFTWNLGDGSGAEGAVIAHVYTATGTYSVTVTATNCTGSTATRTHPLTVSPVPPQRWTIFLPLVLRGYTP
jgi:subtilisin family serine protease/PKD repeat protein